MPRVHARAVQTWGPAVPSISSERIVSTTGVIGWCSAKPRNAGVIELVGTNEGLMKMSRIRM